MYQFLLLWLLACTLQLSPDLTVTLHDALGAPLAGVSVTVADVGGQLLAQATTDASGTATFAHLPVRDVRISVVGQLQHGTALRLPPSDAGGIALYLTSADQLDLIADVDGVVILDPARMWALEAGAPMDSPTLPTAFPTAPPLPVPEALAVAPAQIVAPPSQTVPDTSEPQTRPEGPVWRRELPWLLLAVLAALVGGLLVLALATLRARAS